MAGQGGEWHSRKGQLQSASWLLGWKGQAAPLPPAIPGTIPQICMKNTLYQTKGRDLVKGIIVIRANRESLPALGYHVDTGVLCGQTSLFIAHRMSDINPDTSNLDTLYFKFRDLQYQVKHLSDIIQTPMKTSSHIVLHSSTSVPASLPDRISLVQLLGEIG